MDAGELHIAAEMFEAALTQMVSAIEEAIERYRLSPSSAFDLACRRWKGTALRLLNSELKTVSRCLPAMSDLRNRRTLVVVATNGAGLEKQLATFNYSFAGAESRVILEAGVRNVAVTASCLIEVLNKTPQSEGLAGASASTGPNGFFRKISGREAFHTRELPPPLTRFPLRTFCFLLKAPGPGVPFLLPSRSSDGLTHTHKPRFIPQGHSMHPELSPQQQGALQKLAVAFHPDELSWRVTNKSKDGKRGCVIPYGDQRAYTDRLNTVFTASGWTRVYQTTTVSPIERLKKDKTIQTGKVIVTCVVTIHGIGSHSGVGEMWADDDNAMTRAEAQAFKRACSCFGLGRYFYDFQEIWVDLDNYGKPIALPVLPAWALPPGVVPITNGKPRETAAPVATTKETTAQPAATASAPAPKGPQAVPSANLTRSLPRRSRLSVRRSATHSTSRSSAGAATLRTRGTSGRRGAALG